MSGNSSSRAARRRGPRRRGSDGGRGGRRVLAGRGNGWELWIPEDDWRRMTDQERAALVEGQRALLEPSPASTRARPQSAAGPALDQMTTARPVQLALFGAT